MYTAKIKVGEYTTISEPLNEWYEALDFILLHLPKNLTSKQAFQLQETGRVRFGKSNKAWIEEY